MKTRRIAVIFLVLLFVFCLSFSKSTDFSQDLGRHLKLGEIIVGTKHIPDTNLFSFTYPDFPFSNHHWLSEVIYYLLVSLAGLGSLFVLRFFLIAGAVFFAMRSVFRKSHYLTPAFCSLVFLPLLLERIDIRPELFGYFFFSFLLYLIISRDRRLYFLVPLVMAVWVNIHISFVFGLFLLCIAALQQWGRKQTLLIIVAGVLATFLNPHGFFGVAEPFLIFRNYGYTIAENQNLFFINSVMLDPVIRYYLFLLPVMACVAGVLLFRKRYLYAVIFIVFYILGFWQIRHIPFFVFAAIPLASTAISDLTKDIMTLPAFHRLGKIPYPELLMVFYVLAISIILTGVYFRTYDYRRIFGYGFYQEEKQATDFIVENRLTGNLFNNFDIGGYAIYRLYPRYRVFVDNRPEAYPAEFFQRTYIPLQTDPHLRQEVFKKYAIHTILFSHSDMTPWGRTFIGQILSDPQWKIVFANTTVFVMSDNSDLPDIRKNAGYLESLIRETGEPTSLLYYANFLSQLNMQPLAEKSLLKAKQINPLSCSVKRVEYASQLSTPSFSGNVMEGKSWWCY